MTIPVYIICSDKDCKRVSNLERVFSDELFSLHAIDTHCKTRHQQDFQRVRWVLKDSRDQAPHQPVIIIKDEQVTHIGSAGMADLVERILAYAGDDSSSSQGCSWDLCYFNRYLDYCPSLKFLVNLSNGAKLVKTYQPHGLEALMVSPQGRETILRTKDCQSEQDIQLAVKSGTLTAWAVSPNLFQLDVEQACQLQPEKTWECGQRRVEAEDPDDGYGILIAIGIILILLVFLWSMHQLR